MQRLLVFLALCAVLCGFAMAQATPLPAPVRVPVLYPQVVAVDANTLLVPARQGVIEYKIAERTLTKLFSLDNNDTIDQNPRRKYGKSHLNQYSEQVRFIYYDRIKQNLYYQCSDPGKDFSDLLERDFIGHEYDTYYVYNLKTRKSTVIDYNDFFEKNCFDIRTKFVGKSYYEYFSADKPAKPEERIDCVLPNDRYDLEGKMTYKYLSMAPSIIDNEIIYLLSRSGVSKGESSTTTEHIYKGTILGNMVKIEKEIFAWSRTNEDYTNGRVLNNPSMAAFRFPGQARNGKLFFSTDIFHMGLTVHEDYAGYAYAKEYYLGDQLYTIKCYDGSDEIKDVEKEAFSINLPCSFWIEGDAIFYFKYNGKGSPPTLMMRKFNPGPTDNSPGQKS